MRGEKLAGLTFMSPDGKKSADIMNLANPYGVEVRMLGGTDRYHYDEKLDVVEMSSIESPFEAGLLLHELGHVAQRHEEPTKTLSPHYDAFTGVRSEEKISPARAMLKTMADVLPESRSILSEADLDQLERLYEEYAQDAKSRETNELSELQMDLYAEMVEPEKRRRALGFLIRRVLERDATRRAIRWLRLLKQKAGINLFVPIADTAKTVRMRNKHSKSEICRSAFASDADQSAKAAGKPVTIIQDLQDALATYWAGSAEMRKKYGGRIPFPRENPFKK